MKFEDLIKAQQQQHLSTLVSEHGNPPEGTTHFDMKDGADSAWMKLKGGELEYWTGDCWNIYGSGYGDGLDQINTRFIPLPNPPYYKPKDAAFTGTAPNKKCGLAELLLGFNGVVDVKSMPLHALMGVVEELETAGDYFYVDLRLTPDSAGDWSASVYVNYEDGEDKLLVSVGKAAMGEQE